MTKMLSTDIRYIKNAAAIEFALNPGISLENAYVNIEGELLSYNYSGHLKNIQPYALGLLRGMPPEDNLIAGAKALLDSGLTPAETYNYLTEHEQDIDSIPDLMKGMPAFRKNILEAKTNSMPVTNFNMPLETTGLLPNIQNNENILLPVNTQLISGLNNNETVAIASVAVVSVAVVGLLASRFFCKRKAASSKQPDFELELIIDADEEHLNDEDTSSQSSCCKRRRLPN